MMPPLITVGSSPPASSKAAIIEVVVVLPCVPATAMVFEPHQLGQHLGAADDRDAALERGLDLGIVLPDAVETTTTAASPRLSAAWPIATGMPRSRRPSTT